MGGIHIATGGEYGRCKLGNCKRRCVVVLIFLSLQFLSISYLILSFVIHSYSQATLIVKCRLHRRLDRPRRTFNTRNTSPLRFFLPLPGLIYDSSFFVFYLVHSLLFSLILIPSLRMNCVLPSFVFWATSTLERRRCLIH